MKRFLPSHRRCFDFSILCLLLATTLFFGCRDASDRPQRATLATPPTDSFQRININTASTDELQRLPGIGPSLAEKIIQHRTHYGRFRRAEHLLAIDGMSERRFRSLQPYVATD